MSWADVGEWLKSNATQGAALVGSLLTGNVPAAVAAGVSLVASATGQGTPDHALASLQRDPASIIKLQELAYSQEASIRQHIEAMARIELESQQVTQATVQQGDKADDRFVRWTRPAHAWLSLCAGVAYIFTSASPDEFAIGVLFALPFTYAGLRSFEKRAPGALRGKK